MFVYAGLAFVVVGFGCSLHFPTVLLVDVLFFWRKPLYGYFCKCWVSRSCVVLLSKETKRTAHRHARYSISEYCFVFGNFIKIKEWNSPFKKETYVVGNWSDFWDLLEICFIYLVLCNESSLVAFALTKNKYSRLWIIH